jgi:hypothetical protein
MLRWGLNEFAPPGQLGRSMLLLLMNRRCLIVILIVAVCYVTANGTSAHQRRVPRDFSYPEGSQTVQIEVNGHALSGIVTDPNGRPLSDVLVERVGAIWTHRYSVVFTDSKGRFRFSRVPDGAYYLKLSKPNFSTLKVKVRLRTRSKSKLNLTLPLGI